MRPIQFIGVKIVEATPMTRAAYNEFRGWQLPADENGADEGYLVEYLDGGKPNVEGRSGYVSWSPKAVFDAAYRQIDGMTFGLAIEASKMGKNVARAGWNEGMYVRFVKNWTYTDGIDDNRRCNPLFTIKNVDGSVSTWVPSINDVLAEDWQVVE